MTPRSFYSLLFLICLATSINQTCTFLKSCSDHAQCNPLSEHCICKSGYIANCNIAASPITEYPYIVELSANDMQLMYMEPIQVQVFIQFTLRICRGKDQENIPINLYMWRQDGSNEYYLPNNTAKSIRMFFDSECNIISDKYVTFNIQPNGEAEKLVIGIGNNTKPTILTLTISQKEVLGLKFYYYIMVGLIVFVSILSIISAVTYMLRRRRPIFSTAQAVENINLDHFQVFMPSTPAVIQGEGPACPICLQNIKKKEDIRNTPCDHIFHTACLDNWCFQNLNCPVCRSDFSLNKILEIKNKVTTKATNDGGKYQQHWQQEVQIEMETVEVEYDQTPQNILKERML